MVGGLGFVADAGVLEGLVAMGVAPALARVLSIGCALQVTYLLHGRFTFRAQGSFTLRRWVHFMLCNALGACVNYGVFVGVMAAALLGDGATNRYLALVISTAVALGVNYFMNRRWVFLPHGGAR